MSRPPTQLQIERALERERKAQEKAAREAYLQMKSAESDRQNAILLRQDNLLTGILAHTLKVDDFIAFEALKEKAAIPPFEPGALELVEPIPLKEAFLPKKPSTVGMMIPGAKKKYQDAISNGERAFDEALASHADRERDRITQLAAARARYDDQVAAIQKHVASQHEDIDALKLGFESGERSAVERYFGLVLAASNYPEGFPKKSRVGFVPESKQLVVECDLPAYDVVPVAREYICMKAKDEVVQTNRD
jgi:restriction system protein